MNILSTNNNLLWMTVIGRSEKNHQFGEPLFWLTLYTNWKYSCHLWFHFWIIWIFKFRMKKILTISTNNSREGKNLPSKSPIRPVCDIIPGWIVSFAILLFYWSPISWLIVIMIMLGIFSIGILNKYLLLFYSGNR